MEGKLDMVVCMLGTLSHLLDNKQAAAAFSQAAKHLRPGGLFVVELAHPGRASLCVPCLEVWEVGWLCCCLLRSPVVQCGSWTAA